MNITIKGPTFYDQEDENLFFGCVYRLPGYNKVVGKGQWLTIYFDGEVKGEAVMQLLVLCRRWLIDIEPLKQFKNLNNPDSDLWFTVIH